MAGKNVIRQDVVQITWDVEKSPLDKVTQQTNKFQSTVKKSTSTAQKNFNKINSTLGETKSKMDKAREAAQKFKEKCAAVGKENFATLDSKLTAITTKLRSGIVGAAQKAAAAVKRVATAAAGITIAGLTAGVKYNADIESYQTSFEVMTGSASKATEVVKKLQTMGAATPFEMTDLASTTQLLMNYGFTADNAINRMSMLGDIAQGNADKMTSIATAYGQMSSAGKVSLEDVKQMIEAGFNPLQEISQTTGESMGSLYDRISKGTLSVDEITKSMQRSTSEGGRYFKSMEKQSKTFNGQLSTLKDNAQQFLGTLAQGVTDKLAGTVMPKVNDFIGKLTDAFNSGGFSGLLQQLGPVGAAIQTVVDKVKALTSDSGKMQTIKGIFEGIKTAAQNVGKFIGTCATGIWNFVTSSGALNTFKGIVDGVGKVFGFLSEHIGTIMKIVVPLVAGFATFVGVVKAISAALKIWSAVQWVLNSGLLACPITWIVVGIAALVAAIVALIMNWDKVKAAAIKCWDAIKNAFAKAGAWFNTTVIQPIKNFFIGLWDSIKAVWSTVASWVSANIIQPIINYYKNLWYFIVGVVTYVKEFIVAIWGTISGWVNANVITPVVTFFTNLWARVTAIATLIWNGICAVWSVIAGWVDANVIQPVVGFFTGLWNNITEIVSNVWSTICDIWGAISGWVSGNIIEPIKGFFSDLLGGITDTVGSVRDTISNAFSAAYDAVVGVWEGITGFFSGIWDGIKGIVNKIIGKGKEATGAADEVKATPHARGGLIRSPHLGLVGEAGPEMIIPLTKKMRGIKLWEQTGRMLGVNPTPQMSVSAPRVNLPQYTPESTVSSSSVSNSETNHYSPQFTLNLSGTVDRTTERTVKRWIKDALEDTFDSIGRTSPRMTEV